MLSVVFSMLTFLICGLPDAASSSEKPKSEITIIINKKLSVETLGMDEIKNIFERKKTTWDDGTQITVALLEAGDTHESFVRYYIHKTPAQYHRYWKKMVFSGRGIPPLTFRSETSLMAHVALTKGAIGYISSKTKPSGVKVIQVAAQGEAKEKKKRKPALSPEKPKKKESRSFLYELFNKLFN
ncbi:MAG: hypothetical protein R6X10_18660 [Desulfobacterales bacterium]